MFCEKIKKHLLISQTGAFSPFMFGLLMGVSIFSLLSIQWAKKDLEALEASKLEQQKIKLEAAKQAVEDALLTQSYTGEQADIRESIKSSGYKFDIKAVRSGDKYGVQDHRILLSDIEDEFVQEEIEKTTTPDELSNFMKEGNATAIIDTEELRAKQIIDSQKLLENQAAQIYNFVASNYRFPTVKEFEDQLIPTTELKDAWGNYFGYNQISEIEAEVWFTSPWGYTKKMNLNLKE